MNRSYKKVPCKSTDSRVRYGPLVTRPSPKKTRRKLERRKERDTASLYLRNKCNANSLAVKEIQKTRMKTQERQRTHQRWHKAPVKRSVALLSGNASEGVMHSTVCVSWANC
jgi:hypothetical protein